jgi:hypothetical protein
MQNSKKSMRKMSFTVAAAFTERTLVLGITLDTLWPIFLVL